MKKSKKTFKRVLAVALAALMVGSSLPLASFAATSQDMTKLNAAIAAYEAKMDGKIYKDMKPAYDAYINALKVKDAYEYGGKTSADALNVANKLEQCTNNMQPWDSNAPIKSATPSFQADTDKQNYQEGKTHAGIIYTKQCVISQDGIISHDAMGAANTEYQICYPTYVIAYDGVNTPKMPVMSRGKNWANVGKFCYGAFPIVSTSNTNDNQDIQLESYWRGDNGTTGESNKDVPNKMDFAYNYVNGKHNADPTFHEKNGSGYNNATGLRGNHVAANKGVEYVKYSWSMFKYTYYDRFQANVMLYNGKLADNEYSKTLSSTAWYTAIGGDADANGNKGNTIEGTFNVNTPIYVINTATLKNSINNAVSKIGLANAKNITVDSEKFSALLGAFDNATSFDVTAGDFATNTQQAVDAKANEIKSLREAIDNSSANIAVDGERTGYEALRQAITNSKSTFEAGNADSKYTADSYKAFSDAYNAAVAKMAALDDPATVTGYSDQAEAKALADALNLKKTELKPETKHEHVWGEWKPVGDKANHIHYCTAPGCTDPVASETQACNPVDYDYQAPTKESPIGYTGGKYCSVCNGVIVERTTLDANAYFAALKDAEAVKADPDYAKKYTSDSRTAFEAALTAATLDLNNVGTTQSAIEKAASAITEAKTLLQQNPATFTVKLVTVVTDAQGKATETTVNTTTDLQYGTVFTANAAEHIGANYVSSWEIIDDSTNGTTPVKTTDASIQFTVTSNSTVKVYITEKPADTNNYTKVTLYNQNGSVYNISYVKDTSSLDLNNLVINGKKIEAPTVPFYTFSKWVVAPSQAGEYNLKPVYTFIDNSASYSQIIGVNGAKINGVDQLTSKYDARVNLSGGEAYAIVANGDASKVISYLTSTTAIHVPHNAKVYIAAVKKADLNTATSGITGKLVEDKSNGKRSAAFNCTFSLPQGSTLIECGAVGTANSAIAGDLNKFQIGSEKGVFKFKSDSCSEFNEYTIGFIANFKPGTTFFGRSYVIYKDALGEQHCVYGNVEQIAL